MCFGDVCCVYVMWVELKLLVKDIMIILEMFVVWIWILSLGSFRRFVCCWMLVLSCKLCLVCGGGCKDGFNMGFLFFCIVSSNLLILFSVYYFGIYIL